MNEIKDGTASLVIADPPYGINYQSCRTKDKAKKKGGIRNDAAPFVWFLLEAYRITKERGCLLCFCRWDVQQAFTDAMIWAGYTVRSNIVWDKETHGMGDLKGTFAPMHENIIFATKGSFVFPGKRPRDVISVKRVHYARSRHPTEKPIELMRELISCTTFPGDIVVDPFAGTGAAAVAAAMEQRQYLGFEIDTRYAVIARKREDETMHRLDRGAGDD